MPTPFPTQLTGAAWLSSHRNALLADEPRVGKTGTTILALDDSFDAKVLVVTTASGRAVWRRAFRVWSIFERQDLRIVSWGEITNPRIRAELLKATWDRIVLDESHYAKSFTAARTRSAYGVLADDGRTLIQASALFTKGKGIWCLSGTPFAHDLADIFPMLKALFPHLLAANSERGWPDVSRYEDFRDRYCKWKMKKLPRGFRSIPVIFGGKNESELSARMAEIKLLRTQKDVGIRPPIYETMPLAVSPRMLAEVEGDIDAQTVLAAAKAGDTKALDMHLGPVRRLTGEIKARAVVEAVKDEFEGGLDKIVLAYWHKDVGQILKDGLSEYGVVGIDGATPPNIRGDMEQKFLHGKPRVFLGQIEAAGEAIDLSSSAMLWFVETTFSPKAMKQMSLRITNHTQRRQAIVRVCVLEGSIDEALQEILIRLWSAIREVLK